MKPFFAALGAVLALGSIAASANARQSDPVAGPDLFATPGPHGVSLSVDVWSDAARDRDIPVKIYSPSGAGPFPAVIFSHGLGGDRDAAAYLGEHLASWGLVAIHIQHPGSDSGVWAGMTRPRQIMDALRESVRDPRTAVNRYEDIPFVVDSIEDRADRLRVDPERLGIAGHSFGAHTVLAAAGFVFQTSRGDMTRAEPRLDAGLLLSPPAPDQRLDPDDYPVAYGGIAIPLLHLTGTSDGSPLDPDMEPSDRLAPFSQIDGAPQYLIVFDPGDHGVFSGRDGRREQPDWYPGVQAATAQAAAAFFRAELYGDPAARAFMDGPAFDAAFDELAETDRRR